MIAAMRSRKMNFDSARPPAMARMMQDQDDEPQHW